MAKAWKEAESFYCKALGGDRRKGGYAGHNLHAAINDCNDAVKDWSVEIKNHSSPRWVNMVSDADKAVKRKKPGQFGIGIMHKKFTERDENTLVYMKWTEFLALRDYIEELRQNNQPDCGDLLDAVIEQVEALR